MTQNLKNTSQYNNHTFIEIHLDRKYINIKYQCFIQFYAT